MNKHEFIDSSAFYTAARAAMSAELDRLDALAEAYKADIKNEDRKIAFKQAKWRWSAVAHFTEPFVNGHYYAATHGATYAMMPHCRELLEADRGLYERFLALYESASEQDRYDIALYFGWYVYARELEEKKRALLGSANDYERLELETSLEGYAFARRLIEQAWREAKGIPLMWKEKA